MFKSSSVSPQLSPTGSDNAVRVSPDQESILEAQFSRGRIPRISDLELLAAETGLEEHEVQAWYAQRLAVWRKEQGLSSGVQ